MTMDRDKFLSAVVALSLSAAACGSEAPPPAAEEPAPALTAGAEQPAAEPAPAPAAEPAAAPAPAAEPVPVVQPVGPTKE